MAIVSGELVTMLDSAKLWVLGDRLMMPRLQNLVMMAYHNNFLDKCWVFSTPKKQDVVENKAAELLSYIDLNASRDGMLWKQARDCLVWLYKRVRNDGHDVKDKELLERWIGHIIPPGMVAELLKISVISPERAFQSHKFDQPSAYYVSDPDGLSMP